MSIRDAVLERPVVAFPMARVGVWIGISAWAALVVVLATYHLDLYPTTWFDEGSHLHVAKALAQYGVYADTSSEGFRYFGPTTGIGPTIMLPIAAVFKVFGIGLLQARLVIVAYLLAGLLLFVFVARRMYGPAVAGLASLLLVTSPAVELLYLGRQVLGEVPAFAYLMLGVLLWSTSTERPGLCTRRLLAAAVAFGLVALTKNQFTLILAPTLLIAAAVDRMYYRRLGWRAYLVPFIGLALGAVANLIVQFVPALAAQDFAHTLALYRDASAGAIFVFSPARIASSLKFLASGDVFAYWGLPGVLYGLNLARERSAHGARQGLLIAFVLVGLAWYSFGSIGWARYAFPALAVSAMFSARLLVDLARALAAASRLLVPAALAATLLVVSPLANQVRSIVTTANRAPLQVAQYLDATVPASAVVESWEPELGFLSDRTFHYPPSGWLDRAVRAQWLTPANAADRGYDPMPTAHPDYLVVGPFGKYTGIYQSLLMRAGSAPMASFGEYDIYRLP